jgi:uncharacterized cupin superfamily protein
VLRFNVLHGELDSEQQREGFRWRRARIGEKIGGQQIGATVFELEDGERTFPYHFHHGVEEWLLVVAGTPTVRMPGGERMLAPGDLICFKANADGAHTVRGPGRVVIFSANVAPSIVVYPDSDKVGSRPGDPAQALNFRRGDAVGYWEGE